MLLLDFQSSFFLLIAIQNGERVTGFSLLLITVETARGGTFVGIWGCGRVLFMSEWKVLLTSLKTYISYTFIPHSSEMLRLK